MFKQLNFVHEIQLTQQGLLYTLLKPTVGLANTAREAQAQAQVTVVLI